MVHMTICDVCEEMPREEGAAWPSTPARWRVRSRAKDGVEVDATETVDCCLEHLGEAVEHLAKRAANVLNFYDIVVDVVA